MDDQPCGRRTEKEWKLVKLETDEGNDGGAEHSYYYYWYCERAASDRQEQNVIINQMMPLNEACDKLLRRMSNRKPALAAGSADNTLSAISDFAVNNTHAADQHEMISVSSIVAALVLLGGGSFVLFLYFHPNKIGNYVDSVPIGEDYKEKLRSAVRWSQDIADNVKAILLKVMETVRKKDDEGHVSSMPKEGGATNARDDALDFSFSKKHSQRSDNFPESDL